MTAAQRYYRLKAAGLCVDCRAPAAAGTRCELCRIRQNDAASRRARESTVRGKIERQKQQRARIEQMLVLAEHLAHLARQQREIDHVALPM